jgi:hypothetical protein
MSNIIKDALKDLNNLIDGVSGEESKETLKEAKKSQKLYSQQELQELKKSLFDFLTFEEGGISPRLELKKIDIKNTGKYLTIKVLLSGDHRHVHMYGTEQVKLWIEGNNFSITPGGYRKVGPFNWNRTDSLKYEHVWTVEPEKELQKSLDKNIDKKFN